MVLRHISIVLHLAASMLNSMKDIRNKLLMCYASAAGQQHHFLSIVLHCSVMLLEHKYCTIEDNFCMDTNGASTWQCSSG